MDPLVRSYIHQAYRGGKITSSTQSTPPHSSFSDVTGLAISSTVWPAITPVIWSCAKVTRREALRTGVDILTDIDRSSSDEKPRAIGETLSRIVAKSDHQVERVRGKSVS